MVGDLPDGEAPVAVVVAQPNFFGRLEAVDAITDWAHAQGSLVIGVVNPMALAILKPPGQWGSEGADIVCGDGQPFGVPMASGGPSFGFICCRQAIVRQMPGRIIGRTEDLDGNVGYTLTLQAREQHIRRGKATSNICTNQGLLVTAGTIYLAIMGGAGLAEVAQTCHGRAVALQQKLTAIPGVTALVDGPFFNEFAVRLPVSAAEVLAAMRQRGYLAGLALSDFVDWSDEENSILVAVTEKRTDAEIDQEVSAGDEAGVVESVKAASDIYTPISGVVVAVNDLLADEPEKVNQDAYGDGWFFKVEPTDLAELEDMLDAEAYAEVCDAEDH